MHTTTTSHEKAHGCDPVGFQNDTTNDLNFPTAASEGKAFTTLAARFALAGHTLTRSNPADGAAMYHAGRWGFSRALPDLQAVAHERPHQNRSAAESMRYLDVYDPRARVMQLRNQGETIDTHWQTVITEAGERHRVGRYTLRMNTGANA